MDFIRQPATFLTSAIIDGDTLSEECPSPSTLRDETLMHRYSARLRHIMAHSLSDCLWWLGTCCEKQ
jgi:hypothetical protein